MTDLPHVPELDIRILSRVFGNVTNSYKILFFQALLAVSRREINDKQLVVDIDDIGVEMLALAWYPHIYFRLSFGLQDQIGLVLDSLDFGVGSHSAAGNAETQQRLRQAIADQWNRIGGPKLLRYVPFRLLSPFFEDRLRGIPDGQKNTQIAELSQQHFEERKPLYSLGIEGRHLQLHPQWHRYLRDNASIVEGWAKWHWTRYLQTRNPNVPAIPEKLSPPSVRTTLNAPRAYWRQVLEAERFNCIYSGCQLHPDEFELDHFIPWSFVCHDRPWNLIPVTPRVNAMKSNWLPDKNYVSAFIDSQNHWLRVWRETVTERKWHRTTEPYLMDLHLTHEALLEEDSLKEAYENVLSPLFQLAKQIGFKGNWIYQHS